MSKTLHIPGMGEVEVGGVETPTQFEQTLIQLLVGLTNQLDLLIRLEAGAISRTQVQTKIKAFDDQQKAALLGQVEAAQAAEQARLEAEQAGEDEEALIRQSEAAAARLDEPEIVRET